MSDSIKNNQDHQVAINLVNDLIEGTNPITKSKFEMETAFSSPEIARALFYIRNILNNDTSLSSIVEPDVNKTKRRTEKLRIRFDKIDFEEIDFSDFNFEENTGIMKLTRNITNFLSDKQVIFDVDAKDLINWLENEGYLITESIDSRKHIPSPMGEALGIEFKNINYNGRMVKMSIYNRYAQQFIIEHLKDIYL
jgi:hypothetical protein